MVHVFRKIIMRGVVSCGLLLLFCLLSTPVQAAFGSVGGRPAFPRDDNPRTKSIFVHTIEPGQTIEEAVKIVNTSDERKEVNIAAVDSLVSSGGAFGCRQNGEPKEAVGSWIELEKKSISLGAKSEAIIPFTITAPENAGVGEQNGCITIQEKNQKKEDAGQGISLSFRTGLRVALLVPGDVHRELVVAGFRAEKNSLGRTLLIPSIQNLGNVSIDTDVKVTTKNLFGKQYQVNGGQYPILRDEKSEFSYEVQRPFWGGWYKAELEVLYDSSDEAELGIESTSELTHVYGQPVKMFFLPTLKAFFIELAMVIIFLVIIAYIILFVRKKRWIATTWVAYKIKSGEDIEKVAAKVGISWKVLARANKLQPPYKLKAGDIIQVPPNIKKEKTVKVEKAPAKRKVVPKRQARSNAARVTKATAGTRKKTQTKSVSKRKKKK